MRANASGRPSRALHGCPCNLAAFSRFAPVSRAVRCPWNWPSEVSICAPCSSYYGLLSRVPPSGPSQLLTQPLCLCLQGDACPREARTAVSSCLLSATVWRSMLHPCRVRPSAGAVRLVVIPTNSGSSARHRLWLPASACWWGKATLTSAPNPAPWLARCGCEPQLDAAQPCRAAEIAADALVVAVSLVMPCVLARRSSWLARADGRPTQHD